MICFSIITGVIFSVWWWAFSRWDVLVPQDPSSSLRAKAASGRCLFFFIMVSSKAVSIFESYIILYIYIPVVDFPHRWALLSWAPSLHITTYHCWAPDPGWSPSSKSSHQWHYAEKSRAWDEQFQRKHEHRTVAFLLPELELPRIFWHELLSSCKVLQSDLFFTSRVDAHEPILDMFASHSTDSSLNKPTDCTVLQHHHENTVPLPLSCLERPSPQKIRHYQQH